MPLLAISYPSISQPHLHWIQAIRKEYDSQYELVAPHITLVFHTFEVEPTIFSEHLRAQLQEQPPIAITLASALVVKDQLSDYTHTFLVPDQGFSDLVKLHDKFYSGLLASQLRLDLPYIPHISVASSLDPLVCKHMADEINRQGLFIPGIIRTIDIIELANKSLTTLEQLPLA